MDAETLANNVATLGRRDFRNVVSLLLTEVFNLIPVNVDGPYDGGSDWRLFKGSGDSTSIACQDTVQADNWERKALEDAEKAVNKLGAARFFFMTAKKRSNIKLRQLEDQITTRFGVPATCIGGKEIAEFIVARNLVSEYLNCIGAPQASRGGQRIDYQEIALYAYSMLGQDTHNLRNTVYDDSILNTCYRLGPLERDELIEECVTLLGCEANRATRIRSRIDSLLTRGNLTSFKDRRITLSPHSQAELENAERVYLKEFTSLSSAQASLMKSEYNVPWTQEDSEQLSVYLARAFIQAQLETAKEARITLEATGLFKNLGDPLQDMRDYLRQKSVPPGSVDATIKEMFEHAEDLPIVKKLARAALFVALEGADPISSSKAIGASSWSEVKVMLDTSVAIPYLCASLYKPSEGRFSLSNHKTIRALCDLSANAVISYFYINECAAHLLLARSYLGLEAYSDTLRFSQNGYVAHYYKLKKAGANVPSSMLDYLSNFSPSIKETQTNTRSWIRKIMTDLQPLLHHYQVELEEIRQIRQHFRTDVEREYTYQMKELHRTKAGKLVDHDVSALAHVCGQISENDERWILLTWDRVLIAVGRQLSACGWVVNPSVLFDFIQPYRPLTETHLCNLAHALARTHDKPLAVSAQIIDRAVQVSGDRMQDWEFRKQIDKFTNELIDRIDFSDANYPEWVGKKTDSFLKKLGIAIPSLDDLEISLENGTL